MAPVDQKVHTLIEQATEPKRIALMNPVWMPWL
jgi:phosphatidylinositol kinase/protein kinase (PI-3  family)